MACPPVLHSLGAPHQAVRWRARPPVGGEQRAGAIPVALASLAGPEAEGAHGVTVWHGLAVVRLVVSVE